MSAAEEMLRNSDVQLARPELAPIESAPTSADFLFTGHLHERPVVFKDGLVDPRSVYAYADRCHCQDLQCPYSKGEHKEEGHHMYFPLKHFKNQWAPLPIRRLRNARTNHIMMLSCQEDLYHQETEDSVSHEHIDIGAAEAFLQEDEWVGNFASSSFMVAEMQREVEALSPFRIERFRLAARLALMTELLEKDQELIGEITVMDSAIVTGALARYLQQQSESHLEAIVNIRKAEEELAIPSRIYDGLALRNRAATRLWVLMNNQNWLVRKLVIPPTPQARAALQTGANRLELAA